MESQVTLKPSLHLLKNFEVELNNFHVSKRAKKVLKETQLVVLVGVAGGGRNTLINYLTATGPYYFAISDTTRPPKIRDGSMELDGIHYFFRTEDAMLQDIKSGEFLEAEIIHSQQVSGTSVRELEKACANDLIAIHDFEYGGAANIVRVKPDAFIVGLLPPSFEEWQRRLGAREVMHEHEFLNRMHTAVIVLKSMLSNPYYKFMVSTDVHESSLDLRNLVEKDIYTKAQHAEGLKIARSILKKTEALIKSLQ